MKRKILGWKQCQKNSSGHQFFLCRCSIQYPITSFLFSLNHIQATRPCWVQHLAGWEYGHFGPSPGACNRLHPKGGVHFPARSARAQTLKELLARPPTEHGFTNNTDARRRAHTCFDLTIHPIHLGHFLFLCLAPPWSILRDYGGSCHSPCGHHCPCCCCHGLQKPIEQDSGPSCKDREDTISGAMEAKRKCVLADYPTCLENISIKWNKYTLSIIVKVVVWKLWCHTQE